MPSSANKQRKTSNDFEIENERKKTIEMMLEMNQKIESLTRELIQVRHINQTKKAPEIVYTVVQYQSYLTEQFSNKLDGTVQGFPLILELK